jgi:hypothetical protein
MAHDQSSLEYHLTPTGWKKGSRYHFGTKDRNVTPPQGRVETWIAHTVQGSQLSPDKTHWERVWTSESVDPAVRAKMLKDFPRPR